MSDSNTPRLMAAAKEFNIGKDTLVDFLAGKGFSKDDLKPTSKLTEEMYRSLQLEFSSDKAAKMKSDQIEIPKGNTADAKKKNAEVLLDLLPARKFSGMGDCASKIMKEQGMRALFRRSQRHFWKFSGLATSVVLVSYDRTRHGGNQTTTTSNPKKMTLKDIFK